MNAPLLKYCGNHCFQDYKLTVNSNAHFIGFIFYKGSKRYVEPLQVLKWTTDYLKNRYQKLVGVFVNPKLDEIKEALNYLPLDIIQLHGNESPHFVKKNKAVLNIPIWKAIHHDDNALTQMKQYRGLASGYVIDVKTKDAWGGTGQSFNWDAVPLYKKEAERQNVPCFIAGGINPENISDLLMYRPYGIDLASGIETNGVKSKALIDELERKVVCEYGETS